MQCRSFELAPRPDDVRDFKSAKQFAYKRLEELNEERPARLGVAEKRFIKYSTKLDLRIKSLTQEVKTGQTMGTTTDRPAQELLQNLMKDATGKVGTTE